MLHIRVRKKYKLHVIFPYPALSRNFFIKLASYISFAQNMWTTCY